LEPAGRAAFQPYEVGETESVLPEKSRREQLEMEDRTRHRLEVPKDPAVQDERDQTQRLDPLFVKKFAAAGAPADGGDEPLLQACGQGLQAPVYFLLGRMQRQRIRFRHLEGLDDTIYAIDAESAGSEVPCAH